MRKFFPLILAILVGITGYLYFNQNLLKASQIDSVEIYNYTDYKTKKGTPFMKLETDKLISMFVRTVNSSEITMRELSVTEPDFLIEVISKGKKDIFSLWLGEDTTRGMYENKENKSFYIITKSSTNKLKTLLFR